MSTPSSYRTSGQPSLTEPTLKRQRTKVTRIAAMAKKLRDEVQSLDAAGLHRLRAIDTQTIRELLPDLSPDLRDEFNRLAVTLTSRTELSDAEHHIPCATRGLAGRTRPNNTHHITSRRCRHRRPWEPPLGTRKARPATSPPHRAAVPSPFLDLITR
jgi:hypothetical protein